MENRKSRKVGYLVAAVFFFDLLLTSPAAAECLSLTSGPVVYDVAICKMMKPETTFDLSREKYRWIADLDPQGKKDLFNSYRGMLLKGKVVKSQAKQAGLSNESGALEGDTAFFYVAPGALTCAAVSGKRVSGQLKEVCCDGGGDIPCLLGTSYLLNQPAVLGSAGSAAGDSDRQKALKSKEYAGAEAAFARKHYKDAIKLYEKVRSEGNLDVRGHYKLGFAYRELDQCNDAVTPLKYVFDKQTKKQIWADEEKVARAATFLLARCYSKLNDPSNTVFILNGYLLEPKKYKSEIRDSIKHKDFGWIHTSKEYRLYKEEAQKKLK